MAEAPGSVFSENGTRTREGEPKKLAVLTSGGDSAGSELLLFFERDLNRAGKLTWPSLWYRSERCSEQSGPHGHHKVSQLQHGRTLAISVMVSCLRSCSG